MLLKDVAKHIASRFAEIFGLEKNEHKKLETMLVYNLYDLLSVGKYAKRTMISIMNEFWYSCLLHAYALTDEFTLYPIFIKTEIAPSSIKTFDIDLTSTDKCCVCPVFYASASLGDDVLLTCLINETPVDVKRTWQNKFLPKDLPLTTEITERQFVVFPKRKLKITFENTNDSVTALTKFYVPGLLLDFNKGKKLIEVCYEEMVREFLVSIGVVEEYEAEV